jgi:hypothetical protein
MATTKNYYTGDGNTTAFTFTFPYLNTSHIKVKLDGVVLATTEYTLTPTSNPTTVNFNTAPTNLAQIEIYRETSLTTANNVFAAGSSVKAASLNDNQTQALYALEEQQNSIEKGEIFNYANANHSAGATAPTTPSSGDTWFDSTSGRTYIYYVDTDSSQWVEANPPFDADGDRSFTQTGTGASARTWDSKLKEQLSLKDFGAVGDYDTDDTTAVTNWLAAAASQNKIAYAPSGVYRINNTGIDLPEHIHIKGEGSPSIYTFPQQKGDKIKLKPGIKNTISGTVFIFDGTGNKTETTTRTEVTGGAPTYHSFKYCMKYNYDAGLNMSDIGIILDCDVLNSGGALTAASADNRSDYDVGLLIRSTLANLTNVNIFGYFDEAGLIVNNTSADSIIDPDYNTFINSNFTSVAIIGNDHDDGAASEGLTGNRFIGCGIFSAADHHTRADGNYLIPALYIDGRLSSSGIRGHNFTACNFRTYSNTSISLDYCDDVSFNNCTFELSSFAVTNANAEGTIVGTARTGDISIIAPASTGTLGIKTLANTIAGSLLSVGGEGDNEIIVSNQSNSVILSAADDSGTADSKIQLTSNPTSATNDWVISRDNSESDLLDFRYDNNTQLSVTNAGYVTAKTIEADKVVYDQGSELTIASGVITVTHSYHKIDTEGDASSDDLDTINGGATGQMLLITAQSGSRTIVAKDGTGNLRLNGDFSLDHGQDALLLMYVSTFWIEVCRSDNAS